MSALALNPDVRVEPPCSLPVDYLSVSSLKQLMMCPEKWRRRYIEKEPEPPSGKLVLGSAGHAALAQHYGHQLESGEGLGIEELLDEFSSEWDAKTTGEDVDYGSDTPGALKDSGARALTVYHRQVAPTITPVAVEREFELFWPGVDWQLIGYIDLEDSAGQVRDSKLTSKRMSQRDADGDLQATILLGARRAEGNPAARFCFDTMVRNKTPVVDVVATQRTERQLDLLSARIFGLAREIEWRFETGVWSGASPGTWFCSTCRYHDCPWRLA